MSKFIFRDACPVCRADAKKVLHSAPYTSALMWAQIAKYYDNQVDKKDFEGINYTLIECGGCSTVYQESIPTAEILSNLYGNSQIDDFKPANCDVGRFLEHSREVLKIVDFMGRTPDKIRVLDFGLGYSEWAKVAKAIGCDVYGIEYTDALASYAQKHDIKVLKESELGNFQFDFINTEQVFEHIPDPATTIAALAGSLTPGGLLKISVPAAPNIHDRIKKLDWDAPKFSRFSLNPVAPLEHIQCFNKRSLDLLAEKTELQPVAIPLRNQYKYMNNWSSLKAMAKNVLLPLLHNYSATRNYRFYQKPV